MQLRPRLFLEGNLFVDLHPGSPSAPDLNSGSTVTEDHTSYSVQFDQVLTTLQAPVRENLQVFLKEFGDGLDKYGGAQGFQESFRTSPAAYRYTSEVNDALLGTQPGDLAGFVRNFGTVAAELNQNSSDLQGLVTNLDTVSGAFAASQQSLRDAIIELPRVLAVGRPALFKLNRDFPPLRAFAREALPGTKAANAALDYANPWIGQLRQLISPEELRGLVEDLRPTIPDLASLSNASLPFLEQSRLLSSCFNNVVIPWSNTNIPNHDGDPPAGKVYEETAYGFTGVAGESRTGDANGQEFRVLGGGGPQTISPFNTPDFPGQQLTGVVPYAFGGSEPAKQSSQKTPFRPDVPCETQDPPNMNSILGPAPTAKSSGASQTAAPAPERPLIQRYADILSKYDQASKMKASQPAEAKQLLEQAGNLYAGWLKDWTAFQKASGLDVSTPPAPKGAKR
jgi:phospholipid/cholesterol/gamma-HCH transport system substrate-binding protein